MYDFCDVLHASYCSADVANHVLREYGEGSMGKGIRKLAGEMLGIGGRKSYSLGYESGVTDTYPVALKNGMLIGMCITGGISLGVWCTKKIINHFKSINEIPPIFYETSEEVPKNAQE